MKTTSRYSFLTIIAVVLLVRGAFAQDAPITRPNIVLIFAEDLSPTLGAYGDKTARTPNLDKLAADGQRFTKAFSVAPVCSPSRSSIITGQYPTSIGTHHHRSRMILERPRLFTQDLQAAGYKVFWPGKKDFNFDAPNTLFDGNKPLLTPAGEIADYVPRDKPFLAYTNLMTTHEGQTFSGEKELLAKTPSVDANRRCDPAALTLPPYLPDDPRVRRTIANYYDLQTQMDFQVGQILAALDRAKLADNTVVVFLGDHGWSLPRGKRWLYDSGTRVPMIVRWPGKRHAGEVVDDLVSLLDLAPSLQSWAGLTPSPRLPGRVTFGPGATAATKRQYVYYTRDRMDEARDRIRGVRDARFKYIRNAEPATPYAQSNRYMDRSIAIQAWREWSAAGKLDAVQRLFFAPTKPAEELYDCVADPHEVDNLAGHPEFESDLRRLRAELDDWSKKFDTYGSIPEAQLVKDGVVAPIKTKSEE